MTQIIDPNVKNWQVNYDNDPLPPDFALLLANKAAVDGQLANLPASHPSRAGLVNQQALVAIAIATHPKRSK